MFILRGLTQTINFVPCGTPGSSSPTYKLNDTDTERFSAKSDFYLREETSSPNSDLRLQSEVGLCVSECDVAGNVAEEIRIGRIFTVFNKVADEFADDSSEIFVTGV